MPVVPRFLGLFSSGLRVTFSIDSPRMWSRFVTNALPPRGLSVCLSVDYGVRGSGSQAFIICM